MKSSATPPANLAEFDFSLDEMLRQHTEGYSPPAAPLRALNSEHADMDSFDWDSSIFPEGMPDLPVPQPPMPPLPQAYRPLQNASCGPARIACAPMSPRSATGSPTHRRNASSSAIKQESEENVSHKSRGNIGVERARNRASQKAFREREKERKEALYNEVKELHDLVGFQRGTMSTQNEWVRGLLAEKAKAESDRTRLRAQVLQGMDRVTQAQAAVTHAENQLAALSSRNREMAAEIRSLQATLVAERIMGQHPEVIED